MEKKETYSNLLASLDALLAEDYFEISILANSSALLMEMLAGVNWVGFYLLHGDELLLGPFQGKTACTKIPVGKGVVGACGKTKEPIIVPDVSKFPGYISCDEATESEIVVPVFVSGKLYAVLDLDSDELNRFSKVDLEFLEKAARIIAKHLEKI